MQSFPPNEGEHASYSTQLEDVPEDMPWVEGIL
jgi:hypothetical protein